MNKYSLIYVTASGSEEANKIASHLLEQGLIACANIFPAHQAVYKWEGKVKSEAETAMILKTKLMNFKVIEAEIKKIHSYETPCIISLYIEEGHIPFLDWVESQT